MELSAGEDGVCESPCVNQSAINFISGHGISEIMSPDPNKVLVYCDDINTVTTKKKSRYATQTAAKKKEYAENQKWARAEKKRALEIVPKQAEEIKRLKKRVKELELTNVLLTQPAPRHSSKYVHEEMQFCKAHNNHLKSENEEVKRQKQQAILQHAAKSVELLRKEDEHKKVTAALEHVQKGMREEAEKTLAAIKEKEEARKLAEINLAKLLAAHRQLQQESKDLDKKIFEAKQAEMKMKEEVEMKNFDLKEHRKRRREAEGQVLRSKEQHRVKLACVTANNASFYEGELGELNSTLANYRARIQTRVVVDDRVTKEWDVASWEGQMKSMMKATPNVARDLWEYAMEYIEAVSTVQRSAGRVPCVP
jgi:hypothetical protein